MEDVPVVSYEEFVEISKRLMGRRAEFACQVVFDQLDTNEAVVRCLPCVQCGTHGLTLLMEARG